MKNVIKTAVGGLFILASAQAFSAPADLAVKSINVPVFNLIGDTLTKMSRDANGKRSDFIMQLVCDLARGDKNQQQVNAVLENNHVSLQSIPQNGSIASLLINGDRPDQAATCVAYVATSLSQPMDNSVLYDKGKNTLWKVAPVLNTEKFAGEMRVRMSIAEATAQLYAVIASNLPTDATMTWEDYQQSVAQTVYQYAPEYLRLLQKLYQSNNAQYSAGAIAKSTLSAADNRGRELQLSPKGPVLISRGVVWLGNGKILGKEYFVPVKVIN